MPSFNPKKVVSFLISATFILCMVFLDPKGYVLSSFERNYEKSFYFESCITELMAATSSSLFDVVEISDGDTVTVSKNCDPVSFRLLGVDTPETVDPRKEVQCFGKESSMYTNERLQGKEVYIEIDPISGEKDKFGRMLGYIILGDGTNFNKELITNGYAREYTYGNEKYRYRDEFRLAQEEAMLNGRGLWGEGCEI
jgi:endonuclease YncB( thermonuclease family)